MYWVARCCAAAQAGRLQRLVFQRIVRCSFALISLLAVVLLAASCTVSEAYGDGDADCAIRLVDVTKECGIRFRHTNGGTGHRYIVESVVAGLALFDYDGDGWIDIYFLNGSALKENVGGDPPRNALYRNNGDWTFSDVTELAGVGDLGYGLGVTVADYDNDGVSDLYVNNFGPNRLYRNNGDGTFCDA
ncbi:MAG: VCBS repeat-containing protein, partial [Planctomycetia bacterium]|nr:VCBS repeat-containing protein [Planctomycetia bacterium]